MACSDEAVDLGGKGGDLTFQCGRGGKAYSGEVCLDGDVVFLDADANELLRLSKTGFYVRGERNEDSQDVYGAFLTFLANSAVTCPKPEGNGGVCTLDGVSVPEGPTPFLELNAIPLRYALPEGLENAGQA